MMQQVLTDKEFEMRIARYERILGFLDLDATTITSYSRWVRNFLTYCQTLEPDNAETEEYLSELWEREIKEQTWNQAMYAIKHYIEKVCIKAFPKNINKKNPGNHLVIVPSKQYVIEAVRRIEREDIAHEVQDKAMLLLLYDGFLRKSELQTLKYKDIDFRQNLVLMEL